MSAQQPLQVERHGKEGIGQPQVEVVEIEPYRIGRVFAHDAAREQALLAVLHRKVVDADVLVAVVDGRRFQLPGLVGDGQRGRQDVGAHQVFLFVKLLFVEGELRVQVRPVSRAVLIVEAGSEVDERAVGIGVDGDVVGQQPAGLETVCVDVGAKKFAFSGQTQLKVVQEVVFQGDELGRNRRLHFLAQQVQTHAALSRDEHVGGEETEDGLQVERTEPQRAEIFGMRRVLGRIVRTAEQPFHIVIQDHVNGLPQEIGQKDVAFIIGPGEGRGQGEGETVVFLRGKDGDVPHVDKAVLYQCLERADVHPAQDGVPGRLRDVGRELEADRHAVALVEVERVEVGALEVQVDAVAVVLAFAAQDDFTFSFEVDVRVAAQQVDQEVAVAERAGGQDVVVVVLLEDEMLDFSGLDVDREAFPRRGREVQVGPCRQRPQGRTAQQPAQLQRLGGSLPVNLQPALVQRQGGVDGGRSHGVGSEGSLYAEP